MERRSLRTAILIRGSRLGGLAGIHVEEAVTVSRPPSEVFRFWRNFENLPKIHESPACGVAAGSRHFSLGRTRPRRDERRMGRAHHQRNRRPAHRVAVARRIGSLDRWLRQLSRNPARHRSASTICSTARPPGSLEPQWLGFWARSRAVQIHDDLRRFKQLIETGEIPTTKGQPVGGRR